MNVLEFKAWFEGFTENIPGTPNAKQWTRIKIRVSEISNIATTDRIFVDRWIGPYKDYWYCTSPNVWVQCSTNNGGQSPISSNVSYSKSDIFNQAGRAEALSISEDTKNGVFENGECGL